MGNNNQILQAVIQTLKIPGEVKIGDVVVPGKVRNFLNGDHMADSDLKRELSEYINLKYFEIIGEKIKITKLGIEKLNLKS